MLWLYIILTAYFILAINNLVDKVFLSQLVTASVVYAVWVSTLITGGVALFVIAWVSSSHIRFIFEGYGQGQLGRLSWVNNGYIALSVLIGVLFTAAVYWLYTALQKGEASRVIPLIGGSMPLMVFAVTFFFMNERLDGNKFTAFVFLFLGTVLISLMPKSQSKSSPKHGTLLALLAAASFALFFVLSQYVSRQIGLINGIVWPRLGTALALVILLFIPSVRLSMSESLHHLSIKLRAAWLGNQFLAGVGFLGMLYTIYLPGVSVTLVTALQSVQYAFILILASLVSVRKPHLFVEQVSAVILTQKISALALITLGLYFISK